MYLCKPKECEPFVAKLIPSLSYPTDLHNKAANKNLVPVLVEKVRHGLLH